MGDSNAENGSLNSPIIRGTSKIGVPPGFQSGKYVFFLFCFVFDS